MTIDSSGVARLDRTSVGHNLGLMDCVTVLLEYIDLEWQGTANIWADLCPARPAPGYGTA